MIEFTSPLNWAPPGVASMLSLVADVQAVSDALAAVSAMPPLWCYDLIVAAAIDRAETSPAFAVSDAPDVGRRMISACALGSSQIDDGGHDRMFWASERWWK